MSLVPMPPFPWFAPTWASLVDRFNQQTMPHAILFSGPEGLGALELAKSLSQLMLCQAPIDDVACHRCRSCQLLSAGTHPDLFMSLPEGVGKQIKIEQVRSITQFIANTASQGGKKVIVISPVEALNHNASNALLKSLEEPAGDTVIILITEQESLLLPTIKSRCMRFVMSPPKYDDASRWLIDAGYSEHTYLLAEADNAPLKVKRWVSESYPEKRMQVLQVLGEVGLNLLGAVQAVSKIHVEPRVLCDVILILIEVQITRKMAPRSIRAKQFVDLTNIDPKIEQVLNLIPITILMRYRDRLNEQKKQLLMNTNLNTTLFNEQVMMDWLAISAQR